MICLMGCHSSGRTRHRALSQWRSLAYLKAVTAVITLKAVGHVSSIERLDVTSRPRDEWDKDMSDVIIFTHLFNV